MDIDEIKSALNKMREAYLDAQAENTRYNTLYPAIKISENPAQHEQIEQLRAIAEALSENVRAVERQASAAEAHAETAKNAVAESKRQSRCAQIVSFISIAIAAITAIASILH